MSQMSDKVPVVVFDRRLDPDQIGGEAILRLARDLRPGKQPRRENKG